MASCSVPVIFIVTDKYLLKQYLKYRRKRKNVLKTEKLITGLQNTNKSHPTHAFTVPGNA